MLDDIRNLSKIGPHPGGSKEEFRIAEYLKDSIDSYCDDLYFDEFRYLDMKKTEKKSVNVIGKFLGNNEKNVIICTNIDTIRDLDKVVDLWEQNIKDVSGVPHVEGANEPNSAIAFLIYFAKRLSDENLKKNVILAGFGAQEEWGATLIDVNEEVIPHSIRKKFRRLGYLIGSRYHVLTRGVSDIDSVIAIDAVGIGLPKIVCRDSFGKSTLDPKLLKDLETINVRGFRYKPGLRSVEVIGCDHLPFRIAGIPSTWIIANKGELTEKNFLGYILNHKNIPNYGTSSDTFENFIRETSVDILKNNYDLISDALIDFIRKR